MCEQETSLNSVFRNSREDCERWKEEWRLVTRMVRLNAARRGKDLSEIEIVKEER